MNSRKQNRMMKRTNVLHALLILVLFTSLPLLCGGETALEKGFRNPPEDAKPWTWYHWVDGNVSREGIRADLQAMKKVGIGGFIVVPAVLIFDRLQLDDPVGALSVHLVNGVWGTLAVGIFAMEGTGCTFLGQLIGVAAVAAVCFPSSLLIFYVLKKSMGIRVSEEEELRGLDIGEHGMEAYAGFQIFTNQ